MPVLHNRVSREEMKKRMLAETEPRTTVSFYKYFHISDPAAFRDELFLRLDALKVFGRIYLAHEGINAQISVPASGFEAFKETLYSFDPELNGIRLNIAVDDDGKSFWVLTIKVRPRIVADGIEDPSFDVTQMGVHLKAAEFNQLAEQPGTVIVDMRNHYEFEVGHFENALEVPSDTFRDQLPMAVDMLQDKKDQNIIMYCTGGIRCEKASAYLKHHGFKNVFQLEGGIIEYTRRARAEGLPLKFIGKNFVFDDRLGERITEDVIARCHQCGQPADTHTNCKNDGCHLLFIQCSDCAQKYDGCCSTVCMEVQHLPAEERARFRQERAEGKAVFNKSKDHPLRKHRDEWLQERSQA
jgi:UPF0176 protein